MFEAFIDGIPKPQGSKTAYARNNRVVMFEANKNLPAWRTHAISTLKRYAPAEPMAGALAVYLFFYLPKPKTATRRHPSVKPDVDKLSRAILDCLVQSGIIEDDSRVIELHAFKAYSQEPGCMVLVRHAE